MRYKGEQLKFVEMDDALDLRAASFGSAMNDDPGPGPDDFIPGGNEFE